MFCCVVEPGRQGSRDVFHEGAARFQRRLRQSAADAAAARKEAAEDEAENAKKEAELQEKLDAPVLRSLGLSPKTATGSGGGKWLGRGASGQGPLAVVPDWRGAQRGGLW